MKILNINKLSVVIILWLYMPDGALAYPEFHKFIVQNSGRKINCAFCHTHSDGPEGTARGQIGRLSPSELEQLGRARAAFNPGTKVDNPILNDFGDYLIEKLGKRRILELRLTPKQLAAEIPQDDDLDKDGISNAREYLEGTHPLNPYDGKPLRLFINNFKRNFIHILLTAIATALGLYGLRHLLLGFAIVSEQENTEEDTSK